MHIAMLQGVVLQAFQISSDGSEADLQHSKLHLPHHVHQKLKIMIDLDSPAIKFTVDQITNLMTISRGT